MSKSLKNIKNSNSQRIFVDACGLQCPMPLLKAKLALKSAQVGDVIEVHATDPAALTDVQAYVKLSDHELVFCHQDGELYCYGLQKGVM